MEDASELATIDQLFSQSHRWNAAIVVPNGIRHAGSFDGFDHFFSFSDGATKRLFAQYHLASFRRRDGDFSMAVVGRADVDCVDVFACDQFLPIAFGRFIAPLFCESFGLRFVPATNGLKNRRIRQVEKIRYPAIRVGMSAAHEAVADEADVERFSHVDVPWMWDCWGDKLNKRNGETEEGGRNSSV